MAYTIQRLTIYGLISALESDLRDFLTLHVSPLVDPNKLLPKQMMDKATERFAKENADTVPDFEDLLDYLDLGDELQAIRTHDRLLDDVTRTYIKKYYLGLEGLIPIRNRVMHTRPLEYDDLPRVSDLASELVKSHRALWANLRTTRRELERDPDFAATFTIPDTPDESTKLLHNLPQVEFDDTGFVGREKELGELKRALMGNYPVVTVVGEGGLGKTAIALKACYDLLDDDEAKLDAIVWTTAKATKLTLNEMQVIEGAISSSLGIIENATALLGRQTETSAMDDLLTHLRNNRILLVIDNLETVIDQNIRNLVRQVPPGSRILFTTRIGLGAFDFPIPLSPLESKEAAFYFRRTARVWGVNDLASAPPNVVSGYCLKLQHNPLFIKWFIQSVRAGKRPTVLTSDPTVLLQFCLQNVFNSLSVDSRTVASTLASVNGSQSVASLAFYTDLDSLSIQSALSVLVTSNLLSVERGRSSEDEDRYTLSALARMYIQKFIRPPIEEQKKLISKQNALRSAQEEFSSQAGADIFDMKNVFVRDKDDYIVAKILTRALECLFRKDCEEAELQVQRANDLSPNYFEVHRVKARLHIELEDYFSAENEYETAISLAPQRAPLRLWYAGFLSWQLGDQDRALAQLLKAEELAPNSAYVKIECARVLQYQRKFLEAANRLAAVEDIEKLPARMRRAHLDLSLQNDLRKAEQLITQQNFVDALDCLEAARRTFEAAPQALIDQRTTRHVGHAMRHLLPLKRALTGLKEEKRVAAIEKWISDPATRSAQPELRRAASFISPDELGPTEASEAPPNRGRLSQLHTNYAFVDTGGSRFFFHRGSWLGKLDFTALGAGAIVEFEIGRSEKGPCAINVRPIGEETPAQKNDFVLLGAIKSLTATYGFIKLDSGGDLFFHRDDCTLATRFNKLAPGDRVRCKLNVGIDGRKRGVNVELYSGL
ncbi:NB-ARC domain-containing protein [Bradyrhizobium guangxiense]|uniref:NB-ARC domain-containing protein n=1 Tax=Bradyrhizobium guangxiense TaxID=1325115 RepID=UPI0010090F15|nr:NB-ARC domain-containing protein [Bradyrhizobium guangxiense]